MYDDKKQLGQPQWDQSKANNAAYSTAANFGNKVYNALGYPGQVVAGTFNQLASGVQNLPNRIKEYDQSYRNRDWQNLSKPMTDQANPLGNNYSQTAVQQQTLAKGGNPNPLPGLGGGNIPQNTSNTGNDINQLFNPNPLGLPAEQPVIPHAQPLYNQDNQPAQPGGNNDYNDDNLPQQYKNMESKYTPEQARKESQSLVDRMNQAAEIYRSTGEGNKPSFGTFQERQNPFMQEKKYSFGDSDMDRRHADKIWKAQQNDMRLGNEANADQMDYELGQQKAQAGLEQSRMQNRTQRQKNQQDLSYKTAQLGYDAQKDQNKRMDDNYKFHANLDNKIGSLVNSGEYAKYKAQIEQQQDPNMRAYMMSRFMQQTGLPYQAVEDFMKKKRSNHETMISFLN